MLKYWWYRCWYLRAYWSARSHFFVVNKFLKEKYFCPSAHRSHFQLLHPVSISVHLQYRDHNFLLSNYQPHRLYNDNSHLHPWDKLQIEIPHSATMLFLQQPMNNFWSLWYPLIDQVAAELLSSLFPLQEKFSDPYKKWSKEILPILQNR